jgi:hypothetical protein
MRRLRPRRECWPLSTIEATSNSTSVERRLLLLISALSSQASRGLLSLGSIVVWHGSEPERASRQAATSKRRSPSTRSWMQRAAGSQGSSGHAEHTPVKDCRKHVQAPARPASTASADAVQFDVAGVLQSLLAMGRQRHAFRLHAPAQFVGTQGVRRAVSEIVVLALSFYFGWIRRRLSSGRMCSR